jgi:hypothetical protein
MMAANHATKSRHASGNDMAAKAAKSVRQPAEGAMNFLRDYAKENPEATALWCFGIGFVLGWRLKPW